MMHGQKNIKLCKTGVTSWAISWDWRSAQRQWCCWRFAFPGMWCRVFGRVIHVRGQAHLFWL